MRPLKFVWFSVAVCGIFGSALAFWVQGYAQRELPLSRMAVILIMEPVFGVIFSMAILGGGSWERAAGPDALSS